MDDLALASPDTDTAMIDAVSRGDPLVYGPRLDLARYAWASAVLDAHPELLEAWSRSTPWAADRAVRKAMFRSPLIVGPVAERIIEVRRSGMHTLGRNPVIDAALLSGNPSALRARRRIDDVLPVGLADVHADPNRAVLIALGSHTIDLVIAQDATTSARTARRLGERATPCDPWTHACLIARFDVAAPRAADRRRATADLVSIARTHRE